MHIVHDETFEGLMRAIPHVRLVGVRIVPSVNPHSGESMHVLVAAELLPY